MSLFANYSDKCKVTSSLLQIRYKIQYLMQKIEVQTTDDDGNSATGTIFVRYYETTRYATKEYSYVGLTKAAARNCMDAKISKYTRQKTQYAFDDQAGFINNPTMECMARINAAHDTGGAWRVDISVAETDSIMTSDLPQNPASKFASINSSREYDETDFDFDYDPRDVFPGGVSTDGTLTVQKSHKYRNDDTSTRILTGCDADFDIPSGAVPQFLYSLSDSPYAWQTANYTQTSSGERWSSGNIILPMPLGSVPNVWLIAYLNGVASDALKVR